MVSGVQDIEESVSEGDVVALQVLDNLASHAITSGGSLGGDLLLPHPELLNPFLGNCLPP
jgi:hypothetical protein